MAEPLMVLSKTFQDFVRSEKAGGLLLVACTALSLAIANSSAGPGYADLWQEVYAGLSLEHWINDALMAVFFLFVGLELERELYKGELSDWRNAVLPIVAAIGGALVPAGIRLAPLAPASRWPPTSPSRWASWRWWAIACRCHCASS